MTPSNEGINDNRNQTHRTPEYRLVTIDTLVFLLRDPQML